jgi:hypothetical protein
MSTSLNYLVNLYQREELKPLTEKPGFRRYWPVPPVIESVFEYQNVNTDLYLRKDVTLFFHKKVIKWINNYPEFSQHKSKLNLLNSVDGQMHIYNLLRKFIKKSGINWYDLRDNYSIIKEYLNANL